VWLSRWFDWRKTLAVVKPETFTRWHRQGCRLFWRWKSRPGRPGIPAELQTLIRQMARDNPTWGQERIAEVVEMGAHWHGGESPGVVKRVCNWEIVHVHAIFTFLPTARN
jgi:hypothetical protein